MPEEEEEEPVKPARGRRPPSKETIKKKSKVVKPLFSDEDESSEESPKKKRKGKILKASSDDKADRLPNPPLSLEDAYDRFLEVDMPQEIIDNLSNKAWDSKVNGIKTLYLWLADNMDCCEEAILLL